MKRQYTLARWMVCWLLSFPIIGGSVFGFGLIVLKYDPRRIFPAAVWYAFLSFCIGPLAHWAYKKVEEPTTYWRRISVLVTVYGVLLSWMSIFFGLQWGMLSQAHANEYALALPIAIPVAGVSAYLLLCRFVFPHLNLNKHMKRGVD